MRKILLCLGVFFVMFKTSNCQNVYIPDSIFKAELLNNSSINTNSDTAIQVSEAQAFSSTIDVSAKGISDLTGIEAFTNLMILRCFSNQLNVLDVSNNTSLIQLHCYSNQISALDVTSNTALTILNCGNNQLTSLDVTNNILLTGLFCEYNQISTIDVTQNSSLNNFYCKGNGLIALDLSSNLNLINLQCESNMITSLDLSNHTSLSNIDCYNNQLTSLDLPISSNLWYLDCHNNLLTSLDASNNTSLFRLRAHKNDLTSLNVKNGNNVNFQSFYFTASSNPNLKCILVDDTTYSNANWVNIDSGTVFSSDPLTCSVLNDVALINNTIDNVNIYPNPTTGEINLELGELKDVSIKVHSIDGQLIYSKDNINESMFNFDINDAASGVYIIEVEANEGKMHYKLIKQ